MDYPKFKGSPSTKWIPKRACYRIDLNYCTPARAVAMLLVTVGLPVMAITGWFQEQEPAPITGILVLDLAYLIVMGTLLGFCAAAYFCQHHERIEISRQATSFGKFPYTRTYDAGLPHKIEVAPLPPPHLTPCHKHTVVLTFRIGDCEESFTIWNGFQDADELIERFWAVKEVFQEEGTAHTVPLKKTLPNRA